MSYTTAAAGKPRLAIVTATLNRPAALLRLHESLRNQNTALDWLHVVIDDCSDTEPQLPNLWPGNKHLLYRKNPKRCGPLITRNIGIDLAMASDADLVAFMDDDDYVTPGFFACISRLWQHYPEVGWYIARCEYRGQYKPAIDVWPEEDGLFNYARDMQMQPKFASDVLHIVAARRLGARRFSRYGMYQREWTLFSKLARDGDLYATGECIVIREYLEGGLTQTSRGRPPDFISAVNYAQRAAIVLSLAPLSARAWLRFSRQLAAVPIRLARLLVAKMASARR